MENFAKACGPEAALTWRRFVDALQGAEIPGARIDYSPGGRPRISLTDSSIGTVYVFGLADAQAELRDRLHKNYSSFEAHPPHVKPSRSFAQPWLNRSPERDTVGGSAGFLSR
jgi:hypothetical protein